MKKALFILLLFLAAEGVCEFGKNKVRYKRFLWKILKTENFEVYHDERIKEIAEIAASIAEEVFCRLKKEYRSAPPTPLPLILYGSPAEFEQTNVVLEPLEEWVGGFAEVLKLRIVIPFSGSYALLKRTITHELCHIFCFNILYKDIPSALLPHYLLKVPPPFWLLEGLAEYESGPLSAEDEIILQDAVLEGRILPLSSLLDSFTIPPEMLSLAYKQSHSFVEYLIKKHGKDELILLLKNIRRGSIEEAFSHVFGKSLYEAEKEWEIYLKKKYYPTLSNTLLPEEFSKTIEIEGAGMKPVFSKTGEFFAYIFHDGIKAHIYFARFPDGKLLHCVTKRMHTKLFDYINFEGEPMSFFADGEYLIFSGRKKDKTIIFIYDVCARKCIKSITPILDFFHSPIQLKDGLFIVAGARNGICGIYKVEEDGKTTLLHEGNFLSLSSSHDGALCVKEEGDGASLFFFDKKDFSLTHLFSLPHKILSPKKAGDSILFICDAEGVFNIYEYYEGKFYRVTRSCKGILSFDEKKEKIIFCAYDKGGFRLFSTEKKREEEVVFLKHEAVPFSFAKKEYKIMDYKRRFTPEWMGLNLSHSSFFGTSVVAHIAMSDMLGDHRLILFTDYLSPTQLPYLDFQLIYYYLGARPNIGFGVVNWTDYYISEVKKYRERLSGAFIYLDYPFDRYRRVESSLSFLREEKHFIHPQKPDETRTENVFSLFFVKDNALFSPFGPLAGQRIRIGAEHAFKINGGISFTNYLMDARFYKRIGRESCLASRFLFLGSKGKDKEEFFLGAPTRWRGEEDDEKLWASNIGLLAIELRIPFIEEVRFPQFGAKRIRGAIFFDAGTCWDKKVEEVKWSFGLGLRFYIFRFFYTKLDFAWTVKDERIAGPSIHFILGPEF